MDQKSKQALEDLAQQIKARSLLIAQMRPEDVAQAQMQLSIFIGEETQKLMEAGYSVAQIQEHVRGALDTVPHSHAPDCDCGHDHSHVDHVHLHELDLQPVTFFVSVNEEDVKAYGEGKIDLGAFIDAVNDGEWLTVLDLQELDLVLENYDEEGDTYALVTYEGEAVVGPDGEAFVPEILERRDEDGHPGVYSQPMVCKSPAEVRKAVELLSDIDADRFEALFDLEKLMRAMFEEVDMEDFEDIEDQIFEHIQNEYLELRAFYQQAALAGKAVLEFTRFLDLED